MSQPWIEQAERDLEVARHLAAHAFHEWACFTAQQSAEKAIKAVRLSLGTSIDTIKKHEMLELLAQIPALHPPRTPCSLKQVSSMCMSRAHDIPIIEESAPTRLQDLQARRFSGCDHDRRSCPYVLQAASRADPDVLDELVSDSRL